MILLACVVASGLLTACGDDTPAPAEPTGVPTSRLDRPAPHVWGRPSRHYTTTIPTMP